MIRKAIIVMLTLGAGASVWLSIQGETLVGRKAKEKLYDWLDATREFPTPLSVPSASWCVGNTHTVATVWLHRLLPRPYDESVIRVIRGPRPVPIHYHEFKWSFAGFFWAEHYSYLDGETDHRRWVVRVPLWAVFIVSATYPALAFINQWVGNNL